MSIVSSTLTSTLQADGRSQVEEAHTDQLGKVWSRSYLAEAGADLQAAMAAYAVQLAADLAKNEINAMVSQVKALGSTAAVALNYGTAGQLRTALRATYQVATQVEAIMIGDFLAALTDAQLQAAFGLTAGQVTTLRANKLTPAASAAANIRGAAGQ